MRLPCWCTKQWQNVAQVLHNNRIKFPKDFFHYCSAHQHGRCDITWKPRIAPVLRSVFSRVRNTNWVQVNDWKRQIEHFDFVEPISDKTEQQNLTSFAIKIYFFQLHTVSLNKYTQKHHIQEMGFFQRKQCIGETIQAIVTFAIYEWRFSYWYFPLRISLWKTQDSWIHHE